MGMQMPLGAAGGASRTRDQIFPVAEELRFTARREKARNSVRIIAITRINLHPKLLPCKHSVSCARHVITVK